MQSIEGIQDMQSIKGYPRYMQSIKGIQDMHSIKEYLRYA